jgi:hypothetical protein
LSAEKWSGIKSGRNSIPRLTGSNRPGLSPDSERL